MLKFLFLLIIGAHANKDEKGLLNMLFRTYEKTVRPVLNINDTVTVTVKHTFRQILHVDERQELFTSCGWSSLRWKDAYLTWNPKKYSGIQSINISPEKIWLPDIVLYDDVSTSNGFDRNVDQLKSRLTIDFTGKVIWGLRITFLTKCHFDILYFPFDTQTCPFRYGSWSYEKGRIDISPGSRIKVEYEAIHAGWNLLRDSSNILSINYTAGIYESVEFTITFKRKALFRWLNLFLPPLILEVLVLLSFVLPAASGERLALSVTLLLAMIFFMVSITNLIPSDDATVPIIYKFFIATLIEMVLLIIVVILGMQLYHKKSYDPPMPQWIRNILYDRLSYFTGTRAHRDGRDVISMEIEDIESIIEIGFLYDCSCENINSSGMTSQECQSKIEQFNKEKERILMEWRIVALTIDRCLFLVFLLTFVITISVFWLHAIFKL